MKIKFFIAAALAACAFSSCSDMFDTESDRLVYDPALDNKVDSMFYTLGALKGVQQAIDQYVLTNEMRGDLVTATDDASDDLHNLAAFRTTASTRYDSAYVYYRIINNCNYYIAHRDTTLITSGRYVTKNEYVEAFAIRAWAYLQLAKTYGDVPFYTEPLTNIASIEAVEQMPRKSLREISDLLLADMLKYSGTPVPSSTKTIDAGTTNAGSSKTVIYSKMMIPIDLVIGDLYLETNRYPEAAKYYATYLLNNQYVVNNYTTSAFNYPDMNALPKELRQMGTSNTHTSVSGENVTTSSWSQIFSTSSPMDIITYVPMATNKLRGTTTELPTLFGYNYYMSSDGESYNKNVSLVPSEAYSALCNAQDYYYATGTGQNSGTWEYFSAQIGDMRRYTVNTSIKYGTDPAFNVMTKYMGANIPLYRGSMVYLRFAEAINRSGYPDVAFAVLKDGLSSDRLENSLYLTEKGRQLLTETYPFLAYITRYAGNTGIHSHGSGYTSGSKTGYQFATEVGKKIDALRNNPALNITVGQDAEADTINAVEDLICDEMALELAFEGSRFGDLCRIARHKNESNPYEPGTFGSKWLANKLAFKNPAVDLTDPNNWYMPFK